MGGASSKVARRLPTKAKPTWAGARAEPTTETTRHLPKAYDTKNEAVQRDAKDPQLMANLSRLGPVSVDHHMTSVRPDTNMRDILQKRSVSEQQAESPTPTPNRMRASALAELLEDRKSVKSRRELEELARRYGVEVGVLESVARFVNAPSVGGDTVTRTVGEDGQEKVTMVAVWSEPSFEPDLKPRVSSHAKS